jgi:hypothetical protein
MTDLQQFTVLDPAHDREPTEMEWTRSRAMIERTMTAPRKPFPVKRLAIGVTAAAAFAVAGVIAVPALLPSTAGQAIASWTAKPDQLSGADVMPQAKTCAKSGVGGLDAGTLASKDVIIADQRGDITSLIIGRGDTVMECLTVGTEDSLTAQALSSPEVPPRTPGKLHATVETYWSRGSGKSEYSHVVGRTDAAVTAVDISLPNGKVFPASAKDGWWTAWWPGPEGGQADGFTITVHTATATATYSPSQLR